MRTSWKAAVALIIALLLMLPLAGSALAKPIIVDNFGAKMDAVQDAIDGAPRATDAETRDNHGWYVSQLATDFNNLMDAANLGLEDLNRGRWTSMFSRWLTKGDDLQGALRVKAETRAAKLAAVEERKQNRVEATVEDTEQDDENDEDRDGDGKQNAPGQKKKTSVESSDTETEEGSELNRGLAKKAAKAPR